LIPIRQPGWTGLRHCEAAGYQTVVAVPMRVQARVIGEVDLFFYAERPPGEAESQLLEALAGHFGAVVENVRLGARLRETAVSEERSLLAQELHDSIAQSLAFLKIQVQLLRSAIAGGDRREIEQALEEIDAGVRESYADVRELLVHFRTRAGHEDIEHAIRTTLSKFEHQTGLKSTLDIRGGGVPLPPDTQVQVLHILQEALSNVRKHAGASQVWLSVEQAPVWRFVVRDDGVGFDPETVARGETHVGLRIMRERAQRIGGDVVVDATPGRGTVVVLSLPPLPGAARMDAQDPSPALPAPSVAPAAAGAA
jgi:two-component system nitrate/nitrite sensor histidine kinase NarX